MGVPSTGDRADSQCYMLRAIEKKYADQIELVYPEVCVHRIFHDFARNEVVKDFLATDCDILWFLDSDISPPKDILDIVAYPTADWKVAGACYPVWMTLNQEQGPQVVLTVYDDISGRMAMTDAPTTGIDFVAGLATGCMFIRREVFSELQEPYFEFKYDAKSRVLTEGEDLGFCLKVNKLGYRFYVDFDKVCKHYKRVDLLDVNNYAMIFAKNQVQEYDAVIRPKIQQLQGMLAAKKAETKSVIETAKPKLVLPNHYK